MFKDLCVVFLSLDTAAMKQNRLEIFGVRTIKDLVMKLGRSNKSCVPPFANKSSLSLSFI